MNRINEKLKENGLKITWLAEQLVKCFNSINGYLQKLQ